MKTFSEFVDSMVVETMRPDRIITIAEALNATIREIHFNSANGPYTGPVRFSENLVEDTFTASGEAPYVWPIPNHQNFMDISAIMDTRSRKAVAYRTPGTLQPRGTDFTPAGSWYRSGPTIVFDNIRVGVPLAIAYYTYLPRLTYFPVGSRVIQENLDTGEYELVAGGGVPTEEQIAKESNWMIQRHLSALRQGILAKLYIQLNDLERGRLAYSAFETAKSGIQIVEATE